jgi:hypothetical protein
MMDFLMDPGQKCVAAGEVGRVTSVDVDFGFDGRSNAPSRLMDPALGVSGHTPFNTQWTFSQHSVNIQSTFSQRSVNIQSTFSQYSVNIQWEANTELTLLLICNEHSVNIQWTFSEHSVNIQWTFSEHSVNIQWEVYKELTLLIIRCNIFRVFS